MGKKRRRRSRGMTIPLAPTIGLLAGLIGPAEDHSEGPLAMIQQGRLEEAFRQVAKSYTGIDVKDGSFKISRLSRGVAPLAAGLLVHKFVGGAPLNANAMLARAKVPFIRI